MGLDPFGRSAVTFRVHQVISFSETPLYSEDNTDVLMRHVRLQVGCYIGWAEFYTNFFGPAGLQVRFEQAVQNMADILSTPRLNLTITLNGMPYLQSPQVQAGTTGVGSFYATDSRNGPLPVRPVFSKFSGTKSVYMVWEVETWVSELFPYSNKTAADEPVLLSHRWSEEQIVDSELLTTRTISGRVVFAKNVLTRKGYYADDFRVWLLRVIPNNTQRQQVRVKVASDGCTCDYTTVDKSTHENLGINSSVVSFDAVITKGFNVEAGLLSVPLNTLDLQITLRGRPSTDRQTLIVLCEQVAAQFGFQNPATVNDKWANWGLDTLINTVFSVNPCLRWNMSVRYDRREATLSVGIVSGKDFASDAVNFFTKSGTVLQVGFPAFLYPITTNNTTNANGVGFAARGGQVAVRKADNPAPAFNGAAEDRWFGRIVVQQPSNTFLMNNGVRPVPAFGIQGQQIPSRVPGATNPPWGVNYGANPALSADPLNPNISTAT